jgi:acetyltransferase-like isoleucine patch superfamily enzyme
VKNPILRWAQRQMGTGKLDYVNVRSLLAGIVGRVVQYVAMTSFPMAPSFRVWLQRLRGVRIGRGVFIGPRVYLDPVRPDLITVEELVSLAGFVTILTHSEPTEPLRAVLGEAGNKIAPVTIKRGAWVAIHCAILPGVTIGECAIVASGSVVTKDVEPFTMVGGVPARFIKRIERAAAEDASPPDQQSTSTQKGN